MFQYQMINGLKTAVINTIVDPQFGFHAAGLDGKAGGSLYVPNGEEIIEPIGRLVSNTQNGFFIISNDWHPANHIADMNNHPGVVEYRKAVLSAQGKNPDLYEDVRELMFTELVFDRNDLIIGIKDGDYVRKVQLRTVDGQPPRSEDKGRVTKVLEEKWSEKYDEMVGVSTQAMWSKHCPQNTHSARMPEGLNLPPALLQALDQDSTKLSFFYHDQNTNNRFWVVRKGINSEIDSQGAYFENDGITPTPAMKIIEELSKQFRRDGVEQVIINTKGLATGHCVEYTGNQSAAIATGYFAIKGMAVHHYLCLEACRGIPIPGGKDVPFSLDGVLPRLNEKFGFQEITIAEIIALQSGIPCTIARGDAFRANVVAQISG